MKFSETGFRAFYHQFNVFMTSDPHVKRAIEHFPGAAEAGGVLTYGYIDHTQGLTLEVLATVTVKGNQYTVHDGDNSISSKIRIEAVADADCLHFDDSEQHYRKRYAEKIAMLDSYAVSDDIEKTRTMSFLDASRHPYFPDDVLVYLTADGLKPEGCWVRLEGLAEHYFIGKLLNEPDQDFGFHEGEIVAFGVQVMADADGKEIVICHANLTPDSHPGADHAALKRLKAQRFAAAPEGQGDFERIMAEIEAGLTGHFKRDIAYLQEAAKRYREHPFSKEIAREIGRMIYALLPEDAKAEMNDLTDAADVAINQKMDAAAACIVKEHDWDKAEAILREVLAEIDGMYEDDSESIYRDFDEPMQEVLYNYRYRPQKTLRHTPTPMAAPYFMMGNIMFEKKDFGAARKYLECALSFNPVSAKIYFEYLETFKAVGELEAFASGTRESFKIAIRAKDLARCYRNMGFYLIENQAFDAAIVCYIVSLQLDSDNQMAQRELMYIKQQAGELVPPSQEEAQALSERYDFPLGADNDVLGLAYVNGKHYYDEGEMAIARYFLAIVYELDPNEEVQAMLETIKNAGIK